MSGTSGDSILVTGALGQIGSDLVEALRGKHGQDSVIASDVRKITDHPFVEDGRFVRLSVLEVLQPLWLVGPHRPEPARGRETRSPSSLRRRSRSACAAADPAPGRRAAPTGQQKHPDPRETPPSVSTREPLGGPFRTAPAPRVQDRVPRETVLRGTKGKPIGRRPVYVLRASSTKQSQSWPHGQ